LAVRVSLPDFTSLSQATSTIVGGKNAACVFQSANNYFGWFT